MLDVLPDTRPEAGLLIIFRIWDYGDQEIIHIANAIQTKDLNQSIYIIHETLGSGERAFGL